MQTVSGLPSGVSAPNTVITEYAVSKYHLQLSLNGWLIEAPAPLAATQINAARRLALAYGVTVGTKSSAPERGESAGGAITLGIVIAFGVLAASVGLIRSETARDLRTLTATGASGATRRRSPRRAQPPRWACSARSSAWPVRSVAGSPRPTAACPPCSAACR